MSDFILDQAQRLLGTRHPFLGIFSDSVPSSELFFPCLAQGRMIKGSPAGPAENPYSDMDTLLEELGSGAGVEIWELC